MTHVHNSYQCFALRKFAPYATTRLELQKQPFTSPIFVEHLKRCQYNSQTDIAVFVQYLRVTEVLC